jgi:hypothetical protein
MAYLGPYTKLEYLPGARSNGYGYKAVLIVRKHAPNGDKHDRTTVLSKTLPTRQNALERAQKRVDYLTGTHNLTVKG